MLLVVFVLYINVALYDVPTCDATPGAYINVDALKQLHFLQRMLRDENSAKEMQLLYPEGYVFIYALYALTWCEMVETLPPESVSWQDGMQEIAFSLNALDAPEGRSVFNPDLPLRYGAFYRGWTAYVRGRYLQVTDSAARDSLVMQQFQSECDAIAHAISRTAKPFLESYRDLAWPADNILCLAALSLHDRIAERRYQEVISDWLLRIEGSIVPEYGLIPHGYDLENNRPLEGVRGSSQSLMLSFLSDIDPAFALDQYRKYRRHFLTYRLGLPGIREYPKEKSGWGDIDSGPVVLGIGGAASIVGIKAILQYKDWEEAKALRCGVNALLFPVSGDKEKCYLLGQLPILDAFMAWSNIGICEADHSETGNWRWKFQVFSLLLIGGAIFLWKKV